MTLAHLTLLSLALPLWTAGPDPAALVAGLASPRPAEREEAAGLLEELGRPALPALLKARDADPSPDDPDLRKRVAQLIDLIERQRLLRPTRVALDFEGRTLAEVVEALRERTGFLVEVGPDVKPATRRGTLRAGSPVPFWEAIDLLGASYGVRHNPGLPFKPERPAPVVPLVAAGGPTPPADYAGPFRVALIRVGRSREVSPRGPRPRRGSGSGSRPTSRCSASPACSSPPTARSCSRKPSTTAARTFDRAASEATRRVPPHSQRFDQGDLSILQYPIALRLPEAPGARVKRLRGHIPVTVVARTDGPVVVPMAGARGKTFSAGGLSLTVTGIDRAGENTTIGLKIRGEPADPLFASRSQPAPPGDYRPPYRVEDRLVVLDDQGRVLWWNPGRLRPGPGDELEVAVVVYTGPGRLGPPAELRYHGLVGAAAEIVFDFADLPLP